MINGKLLDSRAEEINKILYRYIPEGESYLVKAMDYSIRAGGKRIRPMLMQESFRMFSKEQTEPEILHCFMSAIEFIHTYSLVHDDLPAMDNDYFRRGKPATHAAFGEAFGVLAGDGLLNEAFEIVLRRMKELEDFSELKNASAALYILANKAGVRGMAGGQGLDVYSEKTDGCINSFDDINYIYKNKTAALLEASVMIGAVLAGAPEKDVAVMEEIAGNMGFAFQIRDDILDITSTAEKLGKPIGSDDRNEKVTYVTLKGLEQSQKDVEMFSDRAAFLLDGLDEKNDFLRELVLFLAGREK